MWLRGQVVDLPRAGEGEEQFLGQRVKRGWLRERSGGKMGGGRFRGDQSHTRKGRAFHGQGLFGEVRRKQLPG